MLHFNYQIAAPKSLLRPHFLNDVRISEVRISDNRLGSRQKSKSKPHSNPDLGNAVSFFQSKCCMKIVFVRPPRKRLGMEFASS